MKTTKMRFLFLLAIGLGVFMLAQAGDLEPPGPPASTMVTLQEIYDKLDECTGGGQCGVPKTGQTGCWDEAGTPIDCSGMGQDGEYQAGVSVDPRFTDNGDGTVTDNLTSLIWLQDANCFGFRLWIDALSVANTLADGSCGLTDGSMAGDWRLPNLKELLSLIDYGQSDPALPPLNPFSGAPAPDYWSSTTDVDGPDGPSMAWNVNLNHGDANSDPKADGRRVWPVRGGP